ncbi:multimerin-2-like [Electrophorus electricus]|uniref:C1q domain-containing protein n=1 Tax=Electrophorus electricus TaxID=8005 RepID=A0A4W4H1N8_ELEEL|nr:multimerin-2-like [Electrophorus electricus]XP_026883606.1 multimerin-2-like [Electrophorus electricus]
MTVKTTLQSIIILGFLLGSLTLEKLAMKPSMEENAADDLTEIEIVAQTLLDVIQELQFVKAELSSVKSENTALNTAVEASASKKSLELVAQKVQKLSESNSEINMKTDDIKQNVQRVEEQVKNLQKMKEPPKVAFSATLSKLNNAFRFMGPYKTGLNLAYQNAITNIGNAYDPNTGIFTAPVRGVYYFSFVVFNPISSSTKQYATGVELLKNDKHVVTATDNAPGVDTEDTAGNSASILLEKGDKVYLHLLDNRIIYTDGNRRNTFSGHLLFEM